MSGAARPQRIIVTGANGAGKSTFALRLHGLRPDLPMVSIDTLKLRRNWERRPTPEVSAELANLTAGEAWIVEGGPGFLAPLLPRAELFVWLDPGLSTRAWRLFWRPLRHLGQTRAELPPGNPDWPVRQYRFALRSLSREAQTRATLVALVASLPPTRVIQCHSKAEAAGALTRCLGEARAQGYEGTSSESL